MTLGIYGQGGTLVVVENALDLLGLGPRPGITLVNTVPSAFAELVRAGGVPPTVRTANLGGEPIPPALIEETFRRTRVERGGEHAESGGEPARRLGEAGEERGHGACEAEQPGERGGSDEGAECEVVEDFAAVSGGTR